MLDPGSDLDKFFVDGFKSLTETAEMKKLKAGFLLKEMLERFTQKTQSKLKPNRSIWIYSGHDITISNLLNSLDLFDVISSCFQFMLYDSHNFSLLFINEFVLSFNSLLTFHRMQLVCFLNCINPRMVIMFNSFTKIQAQKFSLH